MANSPPSDAEYPAKLLKEYPTIASAVNGAKIKLEKAVNKYYEPTTQPLATHSIESVANGAEFELGNNLYYFPQSAYSTVDYILDRLWAKDKRLSVLCDMEAASLDVVEIKNPASTKVMNMYLRGMGKEQGWYTLPTERSTVILCAGTIETAAIALRSSIREQQAAQEPIGRPLRTVDSLKNIGRRLTDHEIYTTRFWNKDDPTGQAAEIAAYIKVNKLDALLTVCVHAEKFYTHGFASGDKSNSSSSDDYANVLNVLLEFEARELDRDSEVQIDPITTEPVLRLRRRPLDASKDFQKCLHKLTESLHREFGYTETGSEMPTPVLAKFGYVAHEVGTMHMQGPRTKESGVVDENLQVRGIQNLFVCDLSVFPFSPMANPSLTLTALAMRLGDYLAGKKA